MQPYKELEGTRLWATLAQAVSDLVGNRDLQETTRREYVVGFLAKRLAEGGLLGPEALRTSPDGGDGDRGTNSDAVRGL